MWLREGAIRSTSAVGTCLLLAAAVCGGEEGRDPQLGKGGSVVWFATGGVPGAVLTVGQFDMKVATLFPQAPPPVVGSHRLDVDTIVFGIRSLYVELGKRRVIIEPGGLDDPGRLVVTLREAGIDPRTIDTVIMTHAHLDHCAGGTTANGEAAFVNARYFLQRREWDHWMAPDSPEPQHSANFRRLLLPIKDRITLLEGDGPIVPGIEAMLTPGHSPGHMVVLVGRALAYTGDALLHPLHVSHPEWVAAWDARPEDVIKSRRRLLGRLAADGPLVVSTHFPAPGTGRVRREGDGWTWVSEQPGVEK